MRIIDSETHPISPSGLDGCYPLDVPWRHPHIPGRLPEAAQIVAESLAANRFDFLTDELLHRMDTYGIEKSVIMRGADPARNQDLARLVREHPDRFAGFAGWDLEHPAGSPPHETLQGLDNLRAGLGLKELRGVGEVALSRFHPLPPDQAYIGYIPTMELCRKYRCPIMFHAGYDASPTPILYRNPVYLEPLAAEYPEVPVILAHMGKYDTWFFEGALMLARRLSNVYLSTSNTRTEFVERAVEELGAEKLLFGSDWSLQHGILGLRQGFDVHQINLDVVRDARIGESAKAMILGENLAALIGV